MPPFEAIIMEQPHDKPIIRQINTMRSRSVFIKVVAELRPFYRQMLFGNALHRGILATDTLHDLASFALAANWRERVRDIAAYLTTAAAARATQFAICYGAIYTAGLLHAADALHGYADYGVLITASNADLRKHFRLMDGDDMEQRRFVMNLALAIAQITVVFLRRIVDSR